MNTVSATARRRARGIAALACLTGLALAGCGTYRAGAAGNSATAGNAGAAGHARIASYAGTAGQAEQAKTYAAMLGSARTGRPVPASAVPRLRAIAKRFAKLNGGLALTQATAVLTTHRKALTSATPGDFVPGSGGVPVYLVTMQGDFVAYGASVPAGASAPTGRYASLVVDARTLDTMDLGVGDNPPPVSPDSLGPVTDLLLPPAAAAH
jgi:hypothetical protein